jgi:hypothetical protein
MRFCNEMKVTTETTLNITASGIAVASGSALVGEALFGPLGGVLGAGLGIVGGVLTELHSQKHLPDKNAPRTTEKANG